MKKLLILIPLILLFAVNVDAQIKYPFGDATEVSIDTLSGSDTVATAWNTVSYAEFPIGGAVTIDVVPDPDLSLGAKFYLQIENKDGTDSNVDFGANVAGSTTTVTTAKTNIFKLFYTGSEFNVVATRQID